MNATASKDFPAVAAPWLDNRVSDSMRYFTVTAGFAALSDTFIVSTSDIYLSAHFLTLQCYIDSFKQASALLGRRKKYNLLWMAFGEKCM